LLLEQQQSDDKADLDPGPALVAVERRNLVIDPVPVDLAGELQASIASTPESLQSQKRSIRQNRLPLKDFGRFSRTTKERELDSTTRQSLKASNQFSRELRKKE
jgi:hypothetical protein